MILGFKNGVFGLYNVDGDKAESLQTFSISKHKIKSVTFNKTGETPKDSDNLQRIASWIAMASPRNGQLIVWEWRSQTCTVHLRLFLISSRRYSQSRRAEL
jgi:hypothetical protein